MLTMLYILDEQRMLAVGNDRDIEIVRAGSSIHHASFSSAIRHIKCDSLVTITCADSVRIFHPDDFSLLAEISATSALIAHAHKDGQFLRVAVITDGHILHSYQTSPSSVRLSWSKTLPQGTVSDILCYDDRVLVVGEPSYIVDVKKDASILLPECSALDSVVCSDHRLAMIQDCRLGRLLVVDTVSALVVAQLKGISRSLLAGRLTLHSDRHVELVAVDCKTGLCYNSSSDCICAKHDKLTISGDDVKAIRVLSDRTVAYSKDTLSVSVVSLS